MTEYKPQYQILNQEDLVPREQIKLVPEDGLAPFDRAELTNLRRNVGYKIIISDTPQNRKNMEVKTLYFQMVAYKEGWEFDPQLYQVQFIEPKNPILKSANGHTRIFQFKEGTTIEDFELSSGNNLGVRVTEHRIMDGRKVDGLVSKVLSLFR